MKAPVRNPWIRQHQHYGGGGLRIIHIQLACACMLLLFLFGVGMRARLLHQWVTVEDEGDYTRSEQLLSLIGLGTDSSGGNKSVMLANVTLRLAKGPAEATGAVEVLDPVPRELNSPPSLRSPAPQSRWQTRWRKAKEAPGMDLRSSRPAKEIEAAMDELPDMPPSQSHSAGPPDGEMGEPSRRAEHWRSPVLEPLGIVPRVNATVQCPLGDPEVERNPLCESFRQQGMRTVAIVGNGPLNDAQRREIDTFDVVIRFNLMNNWRRFKEKLTIWVIRFSTEARQKYWGLTNMSPTDAKRVVGLLQALWLVGGKQQDADDLLWKVPGMQDAGPVLIPQEPFAAAYSREMGIKDGAPSTGFVGIRAVLHCTPDDVPIHLFGFNWHNSTWRGHKMDAEKAFVEWALSEGRIVVHPTICYGIRECGGNSTFDQSCHWGTEGRYVCLRGSPRRWVDLTDTLGPGRFQEYLGQTSHSAGMRKV